MRRVPLSVRASACVAFGLALASCGGSSAVTSPPPPPPPPGLTNSIVFVSDRTGADEIWVMNATDGSNLRQLTTSSDVKSQPAFSPDGRKIAYTSGLIVPGNTTTIHVMSSDGSGNTQFTSGGWIDESPTWSPDGKQIAFMSSRDGGNSEVYVIDVDGSHPTNVTRNPATDYAPSWSPAAGGILFVSNRASQSSPNIYVTSAAGAPVDSVTQGTYPDWSPTGSKFLFVRSGQIFVSATMDGSSVTDILASRFAEGVPRWSPDEQKIAFATPGQQGTEIWTVNASDGSGAQRLSVPGAGDNFDPGWTRH